MVTITFDSHHAKQILNSMESKQIPYAASRALNDTANDIKLKVIDDLDKRFTIRNGWVKKGMRVIRSNKSQWPNLKAEVGHLDKYMKLQEEGGQKRRGRRAMSIPVKARENVTDITPPSKWPGKLMAKGKVRAVQGKRSRRPSKRVYIAPAGKQGRKGLWVVKRGGVPMLMWVFAETVKVPARWEFRKTAQRVADANMQGHYVRRFQEAMANVK